MAKYPVAQLAQQIVEQVADAIIFADSEGRIRLWDPGRRPFSSTWRRRRWGSV